MKTLRAKRTPKRASPGSESPRLDPPSAEPQETRFDIRLSLFGTPVRIHPLFWLSAGALGAGYFTDPEKGSVTLLLLWIICALVSVLIHEFGHVAAARLCGVRTQVVLHGLGGLTIGVEGIRGFWRRTAVRVAGPLVQGLVLGLMWGLMELPFPDFLRAHTWAVFLIGNALYMLFIANLSWALLNLLPIWPLDGGFFMWDACTTLFGPRGGPAALGVCLAVPFLLALAVGQQLTALAPLALDCRHTAEIQAYTVLLVFCVLFGLSAAQALRTESRRGAAQS